MKLFELFAIVLNEDVSRFDNWAEHNAEQLKVEYEFEWKRRWANPHGFYYVDGLDELFPTLNEFAAALRAAPVISLTPAVDAHVHNRTRAHTLHQLVDLVSEYRFPRPVMELAKAFEENRPMAYPIVCRLHGQMIIMGGNTRANVAQILGITPKVKLLDLDALLHKDLGESASCGATGASSVATSVGAAGGLGAGFDPNGDWGIYSKPKKSRKIPLIRR